MSNEQPPCDCCTKWDDGLWHQSCDCQNRGSLAHVVSWCADQNREAEVGQLRARVAELEMERDRLRELVEAHEYSGKWDDHCYKKLEAERDRLREALEQIVNCTPANQPDEWPHHHHYLFVARAALEGE